MYCEEDYEHAADQDDQGADALEQDDVHLKQETHHRTVYTGRHFGQKLIPSAGKQLKIGGSPIPMAVAMSELRCPKFDADAKKASASASSHTVPLLPS